MGLFQQRGLYVPRTHGGLMTLNHVPQVQAGGETTPLFSEHKNPILTKFIRLSLQA